MSDESFLEDIPADSPETAMSEVMEMVQTWKGIKERISDTQATLDALQIRERDLAEKIIPQYLLQHGLEGLDLVGGRKLTIDEDLTVRLPENEEGRREVLSFLVKNGAGSIIKDRIVVDDAPLKLTELLQEHAIPFDHKRDVNTNTLKAWARGVTGLKKGSVQTIAPSEFPKAAGLFIYRKAKIK